MQTFKDVMRAYSDGIYSHKQALYELVEMPARELPAQAVATLNTWLDGNLDNVKAVKRLYDLFNSEESLYNIFCESRAQRKEHYTGRPFIGEVISDWIICTPEIAKLYAELMAVEHKTTDVEIVER